MDSRWLFGAGSRDFQRMAEIYGQSLDSPRLTATTGPSRGRVLRLTSDNCYVLPHRDGAGRPWHLFSAGSIVILTPTEPMGAGRPWHLFSAGSIVILTPTQPMGSGEAMTSVFSQFHCYTDTDSTNGERGDHGFCFQPVPLLYWHRPNQWERGDHGFCFQPVPLLYWHRPNQWGAGRPWLLFSACSIVILTPTQPMGSGETMTSVFSLFHCYTDTDSTNGERGGHDFCFQPVPLLYWHRLNQWGVGRPWLLFSACSIVILTPTQPMGSGETMTSVFSQFHCYTDTNSTNGERGDQLESFCYTDQAVPSLPVPLLYWHN